jgi:ring-1,2-phenylacetyl-CoA epoxidase subunit PaaE
MSQKQTLLEAALKQGLDTYSCQGGILQLFSRVTSGTAEMAKNSILTDGEIAPLVWFLPSASYVRNNLCGL